MGKRSEFVAKAVSWLGTKKGSSGHKQIIADYNKGCDAGRKNTINDPWCADFVGACAYETDNILKDGIGVPCDCSCGTGGHSLMEKAKKAGIWVESDAYIPRTGDVIIYDWKDKGNPPENVTGHDHTGIITSVGANSFIVTEGNKKVNGIYQVGNRTVQFNGQYIRGFIAPKFADEVAPTPPTPTPEKQGYTGEFPTLPSRGYFKKGDKGKEVRKLQNLLLWISPGCLPRFGADSEYGNETYNAVKVCQSVLGVKTDGLWGKKSQLAAREYKK